MSVNDSNWLISIKNSFFILSILTYLNADKTEDIGILFSGIYFIHDLCLLNIMFTKLNYLQYVINYYSQMEAQELHYLQMVLVGS